MLHRLDAEVGVPMVRRRDAHRVDLGILHHLAEVRAELAVRVVVGLVDAARALLGSGLVAVADEDDLRVFLLEELRQQRLAALDADADHGDIDLLAGLACPRPQIAGRAT